MEERASPQCDLDPARLKEILPDGPGVYLFKDSSGRVIYVGKAKNLKKRVLSYFRPAGCTCSAGWRTRIRSNWRPTSRTVDTRPGKRRWDRCLPMKSRPKSRLQAFAVAVVPASRPVSSGVLSPRTAQSHAISSATPMSPNRVPAKTACSWSVTPTV